MSGLGSIELIPTKENVTGIVDEAILVAILDCDVPRIPSQNP